MQKKVRIIFSRNTCLGMGTGSPGGGILVKPARLPATIKVVEPDYVATSDQPEEPMAVPADQFIDGLTVAFKTHLLTEDELTDDMFVNLEEMVSVVAVRTGALGTLEMVAKPPYGDTLLEPAVESIVETLPLIRKEAPSSIKYENLDDVARAQAQVRIGAKLRRALEPLLYGADALSAHGQQYLYQFCDRVYKGAQPEMVRNFTLNRNLKPLRILITQPSTTGQDTKKANEQVRSQTETETLDRVKQMQGEPGTGPAPADTGTSGPGTKGPVTAGTPPLPAPVHGKPKGKGKPTPANPARSKTRP